MATKCIRRFETLEDRAVLNGGIGGLHAATAAAITAKLNVAAQVAPTCNDSVSVAANVNLKAQVAAVANAALATCGCGTSGSADAAAALAASVKANIAVGVNLGACTNAVGTVLGAVDKVCLPSATQVVNKVENLAACATDQVFHILGKAAATVDRLVDNVSCGCA